MSQRLIRDDGAAYTIRQLKADNPRRSFRNPPTAQSLEGTRGRLATVDPDPVLQAGETFDTSTVQVGDDWFVRKTVRALNAGEIAEKDAILRALIKEERDRRLEADFEFQGKMYQRDSKSLDRITGAATLAGFAIAAGAQVGDLRWANAARDFGWIAADDTVTAMDAQTAFAFGQAAAERETSIVFAAKTLREMDPIPSDYTDDKWWP